MTTNNDNTARIVPGEITRRPAPPLPATREEMLSQRKVASKVTLNDLVEEIHDKLYENPEYQALIFGVWDSEAVEGSLAADNYKASNMIREWAREHGNTVVASKNWATLSKSLGVVLRRFELDRRTRRHMVDGEIVPHGPDANNTTEG